MLVCFVDKLMNVLLDHRLNGSSRDLERSRS